MSQKQKRIAGGAVVVVGVLSGPRYLLSALGLAVLQEGIEVSKVSSPALSPPAQGGTGKAVGGFVMNPG